MSMASKTAPEKITVLVVDDSAFMRKTLAQIIDSDPKLRVVGMASDGVEALEKVKQHQPDVVTLDIAMPVMNGHEALKRIRRECRNLANGLPAVLVCSSLTTEGSRDALAAMREGAADVIAKESSQSAENVTVMGSDLIAKIKAVAQSRSAAKAVAVARKKEYGEFESQPLGLATARIGLVAIGSSTGGPPVLEKILTQLPANMPVPIVIAQHMPKVFTKALAERLDQTCELPVVHGESGMRLARGVITVIPGGTHGHLSGNMTRLTLELSDEPTTETYRPSVNVLLGTAARCFGRAALGVILTGMGEDGKVGGTKLIAAGGKILAQDPMSSVVYGMPKAAAAIGAHVMTIDHIAQSLKTLATVAGSCGAVRAA